MWSGKTINQFKKRESFDLTWFLRCARSIKVYSTKEDHMKSSTSSAETSWWRQPVETTVNERRWCWSFLFGLIKHFSRIFVWLWIGHNKKNSILWSFFLLFESLLLLLSPLISSNIFHVWFQVCVINVLSLLFVLSLLAVDRSFERNWFRLSRRELFILLVSNRVCNWLWLWLLWSIQRQWLGCGAEKKLSPV